MTETDATDATSGISSDEGQRPDGEAADAPVEGAHEGGHDGGERDADGNRRSESRLKPAQLASAAAQQLSQLTGRAVDAVVGLRPSEDGWLVTLELVEVSRVPSSTDLIGVYEVDLDRSGDLAGYERVRRHMRGQAGEDHA